MQEGSHSSSVAVTGGLPEQPSLIQVQLLLFQTAGPAARVSADADVTATAARELRSAARVCDYSPDVSDADRVAAPATDDFM